ncbi:hypothetical protein [Endozoicomonas sp. YOMI1]|uniref:hypothetical protein n=1 Tax=Endozoicomonas sp. YOMI1 TaxID=2828739 RepID=UPI002148F860|nr:hypothetical protein [Endozoicomonas sp. YOMI1]
MNNLSLDAAKYTGIGIPDNSEGATDACGSGNEQPAATPCCTKSDVKQWRRGLAIVAVSAGIGAGIELLSNHFAKERDGYYPEYTERYPQPLMGTCTGAFFGFYGALAFELITRPVVKLFLENRSIRAASDQPNAIPGQDTSYENRRGADMEAAV